ncbi:MAG: hypothetical protein U0871_00060 [Gemmataceae bacterium]
MPVIQKTVGGADISRHADLVAALAGELTTPTAFGQPLVMEEEFPRTGRLGVTVVWDRFDRVSDLDRPSVIRKAYEVVHPNKAKRIAFANGYTIPEGEGAGLLPYRVDLAIADEPPPTEVTDRCRSAMTELGASLLRNPAKPELRFATSDQATDGLKELVHRVPESAGLWTIYAEARFTM